MSNTSITVAPYRLEKNDWLTLTAKRLTLAYRFGNYGYIDGFDFRTACAHKLGFSGAMAGAKLPTGRIWIGHDGKHPPRTRSRSCALAEATTLRRPKDGGHRPGHRHVPVPGVVGEVARG